MAQEKTVNIYVTQTFQGNVEGQVKGVEIGQISAALGEGAVGVVEQRIPRVLAPRSQEGLTLIGRDALLEQAAASLRQGGKFYFHGTYGVGKTTLASELFNRTVLEHEPVDGYLWGSVADMSAEDALEWIAGALQEPAVSQATGQQAKINLLRQALSIRKGLLIGLDDVGDYSVAQALLNASGHCPLILNGVRALDTAGLAQAIELKPLQLGEARQLFTSLAYPPETHLTDADVQKIDQIVTALGRLPLVVRLVARQRRQGVSLNRLLDMLEYAPGSLLSSEQGLKTYLEKLHQEIQTMPAARQVILRLACFPAHQAPADAISAGIPKGKYYDAEGFLTERELVERLEGDRLQLHTFLALWIQIAEQDAFQAERGPVIDWLIQYAEQNRAGYDALDIEQSNFLGLLSQLEQGERWDDLAAVLSNLFSYLRVRGLWGVNFHTLDAILENQGSLQDPHHTGWAYLSRAIMHTLRGQTQAASADLDQADQVFVQTGNKIYRGKTLYRRAALTHMAGDLNQAAAQLEQALEWMGDQDPEHDPAGAHERLATIYAAQGRRMEAESHLQRAIDLGDPEIQARAYIRMGSLARLAGDYDQAKDHYQRALQLAKQLGHLLQQATISQELGYLLDQQGQTDQAEASFESAGQIYQQLNFPLGLAHIQHALGNIAFARKDLAAALQRYQAALDLNQAEGVQANAAYNRYMLGVVYQRHRQFDLAAAAYQAALQAAQQMGDLGLQASTLYQSASLAFEQDNPATANQAVQQALELARQAQDRQTEASSLALLGRLQALDGQVELARQALAAAQALFTGFNPEAAAMVAKLLEQLEAQSGEEAPILFGKREKTGDNLDVVSSGGLVLGAEPEADSSGEFSLTERGGVIFGRRNRPKDEDTETIDRVQDSGDIIGMEVDEE